MKLTPIIIHSFVPFEGRASVGGFDWGHEGTPAEDDVRRSYAASADTTYQDYTGTHEERLLRIELDADLNPTQITDLIDSGLLDAIESGGFDDTGLLAHHTPDTEQENA